MTPERLAEIRSALKMAFRDAVAWRENAPIRKGHILPHQAIDEAAEFYVSNHPPIVQHIQSIKAEIDALARERDEWKDASEENLRCIGKVETRLEAENARLAGQLEGHKLQLAIESRRCGEAEINVAKLREALEIAKERLKLARWYLGTQEIETAERVLAETA